MENGSNLVPKHQPKERIYTLCQMELALMVGTSQSYHKGLKLLNRLLHRDSDSKIRFRTYRDFCERMGKKCEDYMEQETHRVMLTHHFDPESGKATEWIASELKANAKPCGDDTAIHNAIEKINRTRPLADEQIKASEWKIEDSKQTCYISLDDIGVKHQKERRKEDSEKNGVYVWNTVADIETCKDSYTLTGVGMKKTVVHVLAHLLQNNLIADKTLVFFTDGAKNIFANISEVFSFHPYTIILDWYHLKKRCQEYLSMSVKGREKRNAVLQKLLRILWVGNVDEAIAYLQNLDESTLRPINRIDDLRQYIEKHREHIPPYALRAELGLRNSSNHVEKANDLCVAQRQKHNGMSWSTSGSSALAQISALILNNQLLSWLNIVA